MTAVTGTVMATDIPADTDEDRPIEFDYNNNSLFYTVNGLFKFIPCMCVWAKYKYFPCYMYTHKPAVLHMTDEITLLEDVEIKETSSE